MVQTMNAQVSISAGTGFLRGFQSEMSFYGLHGGFELPRNNDVTLYGRIGHYFSQSSDDISGDILNQTNFDALMPPSLQVNYSPSINYTTLEGGTRYYIGNDYDNGFSGYGGTNFLLAFNKVKRAYEKTGSWFWIDPSDPLDENGNSTLPYTTSDFDWSNNYDNPGLDENGRWISFALGLQGGVKYTIPGTGTVYFDISAQYFIAGAPNNTTAENASQLVSPLVFIFNVGFRKDLY